MKKKLFAIFTVAVLSFSTVTLALAHPMSGHEYGYALNYGYGCGYETNYGLMCDADGNFLPQEDFEDVLDALTEDGSITADDRDYLLEMYDFCAERMDGGLAGRGGCCRR